MYQLAERKICSSAGYALFLAEPLLFYEPEFENLEWQTSTAAQEDIIQHLQKMWTQYATK